MDERMTITPERINRIIDAMSVLSLGAHDPQKTWIAVTEEDEFSIVEHALNELSGDLSAARTESERLAEIVEAQRQAIRLLSEPLAILLKQLGIQVAQQPADTNRKELKIIMDELRGVRPADPHSGD